MTVYMRMILFSIFTLVYSSVILFIITYFRIFVNVPKNWL
jgi:hypothetical protein